MPPVGSQPLDQRETTLFKRILKCYETKQYKNGLKFAKQILSNPKFSDHGETLAMRGLILNSLGRRDEAFESSKAGLKSDIKSYVCWHVYGLLQRSVQKYEEAAKAYRQALLRDSDNQQILRDLALLQIQTRDYEGYKDTRYKLLTLRPTMKVAWLGYATAHHLLGNHSLALDIMNQYLGTYESTRSHDVDLSHMYQYMIEIRIDAGDRKAGLKFLGEHEDKITDKYYVMMTRARLLEEIAQESKLANVFGVTTKELPCVIGDEKPLGDTDSDTADKDAASDDTTDDAADLLAQASAIHLKLCTRNPDNLEHYTDYIRTKGWSLPADRDQLSDFLAAAEKEHKRAAPPKTLQLKLFAHDDTLFVAALRGYLISHFQRGVPQLQQTLYFLYEDSQKVFVLDDMLDELVNRLRSTGTFDSVDSLTEVSVPSSKEPPTTLLWAEFTQLVHFDKLSGLLAARLSDFSPKPLNLSESDDPAVQRVCDRLLRSACSVAAADTPSDEHELYSDPIVTTTYEEALSQTHTLPDSIAFDHVMVADLVRRIVLRRTGAMIAATPTLISLLELRARVLKHVGRIDDAVACMTEAESLDTADRYINSKCAKYLMRANRIEDAAAMCGRIISDSKSTVDNLTEMQAMWFHLEGAAAHKRLSQYGEALKKCHLIERYMMEFSDDQHDFHTYCLRKMTLAAYVRMLRWEDTLRRNDAFARAAHIAIDIYLELYDDPATILQRDAATASSSGAERAMKDAHAVELEKAHSAGLDQNEIRKLKNKHRKQLKRFAREREEEEAKSRKSDEIAAAAKRKQVAAAAQDDETVLADDVQSAKRLLECEKPLDEALIFLRPLQAFHSHRLSTHTKAFDIYSRRNKIFLQAQALLKIGSIDCSSAVFRSLLLRFTRAVKKATSGDSPSVSMDPSLQRSLAGVLDTLVSTAQDGCGEGKRSKILDDFMSKTQEEVAQSEASVPPASKDEPTNEHAQPMAESVTVRDCLERFEKLTLEHTNVWSQSFIDGTRSNIVTNGEASHTDIAQLSEKLATAKVSH